MARVSIGLPLYNGAGFLQHALELLVSQTFDDIEIIISDNGSRDASPEICRSFADRDSRIRYIRQAETSEASVNFTYVLGQAQTPYFMWAAHDDEWSPNFVEALHGALERDPLALSAQAECVFIDAKGDVIQRGLPNRQLASASCATRVAHVMGHGPADRYNNMFMYGMHRTAMLRRFGIKPILLARGQSRYNELPLLFSLGAAGHLITVPEAQFYYRFHSGQYAQGHVVPFRDAVRLEVGLLASIPRAVWEGSPSVLACLAGIAAVAPGRAKFVLGLAKTVLRDSLHSHA